MAEIKVVINDVKTGKSYQKVFDGSLFFGKKIGDKVSGNELGLSGYELDLVGGSDKSGFPMRKDLPGTIRKRLLLTSGVGVNISRKGMRVKRSVVGNTVSENIVQVNLKVVKVGSKSIPDSLGIEVKKKEEPKVEEKPVEEKKEEPKVEEKPVEKEA